MEPPVYVRRVLLSSFIFAFIAFIFITTVLAVAILKIRAFMLDQKSDAQVNNRFVCLLLALNLFLWTALIVSLKQVLKVFEG